MKKLINQKGSTMLETIMYIGILGTLGAVLASYAASAFGRYRTGRIGQQVIDLKKSIINYTAADEDYRKLNFSKMISSKSMPLDMRDGYHALGGKITLGPVMAKDDAPTTQARYLFYITFEGIPKKACVEIISQGQFYNDGADMDSLVINDKTSWSYAKSFYDVEAYPNKHILMNSATSAVGIRPNLSDILKACTEEHANKITWIFS